MSLNHKIIDPQKSAIIKHASKRDVTEAFLLKKKKQY